MSYLFHPFKILPGDDARLMLRIVAGLITFLFAFSEFSPWMSSGLSRPARVHMLSNYESELSTPFSPLEKKLLRLSLELNPYDLDTFKADIFRRLSEWDPTLPPDALLVRYGEMTSIIDFLIFSDPMNGELYYIRSLIKTLINPNFNEVGIDLIKSIHFSPHEGRLSHHRASFCVHFIQYLPPESLFQCKTEISLFLTSKTSFSWQFAENLWSLSPDDRVKIERMMNEFPDEQVSVFRGIYDQVRWKHESRNNSDQTSETGDSR